MLGMGEEGMGGYRKSTVNPGGEIVCGVKSESSPLVTVSGDLDGLLFLVQ